MGKPWTAGAPLPGGDMEGADPARYIDTLRLRYPALSLAVLGALFERHGSCVPAVLGSARSADDLGECFGAQLYAREIDYFIAREWAQDAEDVLWRRTKAGLHLSPENQTKVRAYVAARLIERMR